LSLSGSAETAIASSLSSTVQGLAGRPVTSIPIPTVNTDGSAVSMMAGLSTINQSGPGVSFTESVSREYIGGALKAIQEAFR